MTSTVLPQPASPSATPVVEPMHGTADDMFAFAEGLDAQALATPHFASDTEGFTVLCVDDEVNIQNALRRLLRRAGYQVLTASGGVEGLNLLQANPVDLVISDMRMPQMDGVEFLGEVRAMHPGVLRILLTGYADIGSTVGAINHGQILRYVAKPWNDDDLLAMVASSLEIKRLERERDRLEKLTQKQNAELKELNEGLEQKVAQRTQEVSGANQKLRQNFITSIKVFSNLIDLRGGELSGHSRRVGELAVKIAMAMGLPPQDQQDVLLASLLHDIGKIGFSDDLLAKSVSKMNINEVKQHRGHAEAGQKALMALDNMASVARIIRSHHELWDGTGYPDGLSGETIPVNARIISLANDFDALQIGTLAAVKLKRDQAIQMIVKGAGKRYDPKVVMAFERVVFGAEAGADEKMIAASDVKAGMVIARDVISSEGLLMLTAGHVLTEHYAERLKAFKNPDESTLNVWIKIDPPKEA